MRFTEREMTVAIDAVAGRAFESMPRMVRRRAGASHWADLSRERRYRHLVAAGDLVLPGLTALPERPTVGAAPEFSDAEYHAAAEEALTSRGRSGRRQLLVAVSTLRTAIAAMPIRQDPDAIVVPDHL